MKQILVNPRQLWKRYTVAVVLIATFATLSHISFLYASSAAEELAGIVNLSGRQRMLSQRILYFASQRIAGESVDHNVNNELREAVALFEASHDKLTRADQGTPPAASSDELRAIYFADTAEHRLDAETRNFIRDARLVINADGMTSVPAFQRLVDKGAGSFLPKLDRAVHAYETLIKQRVNRIEDIANISFALAVLVLLGEALLIFWPAHNSIVRNLDALESNAAKLKASEAEARKLVAEINETTTALVTEKKENEMQRQFVSLVSHEFRTPLAIIDGAASRMQRRRQTLDGQSMESLIDKIRSAVTRLTELIESTLNTDKVYATGLDLCIDTCPIKTLIRDVCNRQQDISPNHVIEVDLSIGPDVIMADSKQLDHVFANLISNAVKYSPDTKLVKVQCRAEGNMAVAAVSDSGVGIPEDELSKLFQRFFRATTSAGIRGTGIGLNLAQTIVEMHEGKIEVASRVGEGSQFAVHLPLNGPTSAQRRAGTGQETAQLECQVA